MSFSITKYVHYKKITLPGGVSNPRDTAYCTTEDYAIQNIRVLNSGIVAIFT